MQAKTSGVFMGFTQVPNQIIRSKKLNAYDKTVLFVIASYNPSFPSYEKIAEDAGLSRDTVWKCLKRLKKIGLISINKEHRSNTYTLNFDRMTQFKTSPQDGLLDALPVRNTDSRSPPHRLVPVRNTDSNNTNRKRTKKKREVFEILKPEIQGEQVSDESTVKNSQLVQSVLRGAIHNPVAKPIEGG
jgi:biotin operon repressor